MKIAKRALFPSSALSPSLHHFAYFFFSLSLCSVSFQLARCTLFQWKINVASASIHMGAQSSSNSSCCVTFNRWRRDAYDTLNRKNGFFFFQKYVKNSIHEILNSTETCAIHCMKCISLSALWFLHRIQ